MNDPRYQTNCGLLKEGQDDRRPVTVDAGEIYKLADLIGYDKKKLLMMAGEEGRD